MCVSQEQFRQTYGERESQIGEQQIAMALYTVTANDLSEDLLFGMQHINARLTYVLGDCALVCAQPTKHRTIDENE